jgi:hypothetical protein
VAQRNPSVLTLAPIGQWLGLGWSAPSGLGTMQSRERKFRESPNEADNLDEKKYQRMFWRISMVRSENQVFEKRGVVLIKLRNWALDPRKDVKDEDCSQ